MSVTFNAGFNLYEGTLAERPVEGATYFQALFRATDTGATYRCENQPPEEGFSYTGTDGYYWNAATQTAYRMITPQSGDVIGNTTSETEFESRLGLLSGTVSIGTVLRITAAFRYGSKLVAPGTLALRLKHDDGGGGDTMLASSAYALPLGATAQDIVLSAMLTCTNDGQVMGRLTTAGLIVDSGQGTVISCTPVVGFNFDTIADEAILLSGQFSVADVANTITLRQFIIEILSATEG